MSENKNLVYTYELKNNDIFTIDIWTFLREEMYKYPYFKVLTIEEIYKVHFVPPYYGLIMIRFEKERE